MRDKIANNKLEIEVKHLGAELTSIKTIEDGTQFLWQGDPKYWAGQSYILFPIIGRLIDGKYQYKGKTYEMIPHGFSRSSDFTIHEQTQNSLTYKLSYSEETLRQYPFKFEFFVSYTLEDNTVKHGFKVKNLDEKVMLFAVGGHPGFNCPLFPGETMEDYTMAFEKPENIKMTNDAIFIKEQTEKKLKHSIFYDGVAIVKDLKSQWVQLKSTKNGREVKVHLKDFPDLAIWSPAIDAPFICFEPLYRLDLSNTSSLDFEKKEGLSSLEPGKVFECEYLIEIN